MSETTALSVRKTAMPVSNMAELAEAGALIARSGLCGVKDAASGFIVAMACHQEGMSVLDFPRKYHIINGRLSMRSDAMLAEFRARGGRYKIVEASQQRAEISVSWEGSTLPFSYTMDDGARTGDALAPNGKLKDNWLHRPEAMLWARCVSRMIRMLCPEIVAGVYTPEEIEDIPTSSTPSASVSVDKAVAKAKVVQAVVSEARSEKKVEVDATAKEPDYSLVPDGFGELSGKKWQDLDEDVLLAASESDILPHQCHEIIKHIIEDIVSKKESAQ